jgi:hypothetical protein
MFLPGPKLVKRKVFYQFVLMFPLSTYLFPYYLTVLFSRALYGYSGARCSLQPQNKVYMRVLLLPANRPLLQQLVQLFLLEGQVSA